jgi:1-acyl-sn-glycerol-3-phosphate acyltransferase
MTILRNLAFYVIFYGGSLFSALALGRKALIVVAAGWSTWHRRCVTGLLGIRIRVEGELPGEGTLVALKHESFFEAIDLPNLLGRPGVIAKAELMRIPLWGQAARVYGLVAVERDQGAKALRAMIAGARRLVSEGRPLAIFPEGTRVPHGRAAPLQSGFAGLYKLLGLPVVPIAVDSGPLYHRRWKRRGTITFRIGETIPTGLPREEIEARVLAAINALNTTSV